MKPRLKSMLLPSAFCAFDAGATVSHIDCIAANDPTDGTCAIGQAQFIVDTRANRTFRINPIGDGFQMRTLPMYKTWITKIEPLRPIRISRAAMETLSAEPDAITRLSGNGPDETRRNPTNPDDFGI